MARIIFDKNNQIVDLKYNKNRSTGFVNDRDTVKKRSNKYLEIISKLDTDTLKDTKGMKELLGVIQNEFGAAGLVSFPLGIVAKCYLGDPYEVHTLDLTANIIIRHYKSNEKMDHNFEKARVLAIHNAYALVEVYKDKMILIHKDGTATKL